MRVPRKPMKNMRMVFFAYFFALLLFTRAKIWKATVTLLSSPISMLIALQYKWMTSCVSSPSPMQISDAQGLPEADINKNTFIYVLMNTKLSLCLFFICMGLSINVGSVSLQCTVYIYSNLNHTCYIHYYLISHQKHYWQCHYHDYPTKSKKDNRIIA